MALVLWLMVLVLLTQSCSSSLEQIEVGCKLWQQRGEKVICDECYPGNRLISLSGLNPKELCRPCEPGTYTVHPLKYRCSRCRQCIGPQILLKNCTIKEDTQCGCKNSLLCGDASCSFCKDKCAKGYELTSDYSCRPCPHGTYNDGHQQQCQPWSSRCPDSNQIMVAKGNASSDILCISSSPSVKPAAEDPARTTVLYAVIIAVMIVLFIITSFIMIVVALKINQKIKKSKKQRKPTPIIRPPTDEPRTLIAIECSFHEAQQEQGNSTESLIKDSSEEMTA